MESSNEVDFDLTELLVGADDVFKMQKTLFITFEHTIDEDGDPSMDVELQASGLDSEGIVAALRIALAVAYNSLSDLEDDDDDDD